jgi:mono/diheme cytochrome c family protein
MKSSVCFGISATILVAFGTAVPARGDDSQIARGKYLVSVIGCSDCHTPGTFLGKPDMSRFLGGSDVGFEIPGMGVFYGANLTPDKVTGLGDWSATEIATAITTGKLPNGRILAPAMPVEDFKNLTAADAQAIAAYLQSVPGIKNKVPGPFGVGQMPSSFVYQVLPPNKYVPTPAPPSK